MRNAQEYLIDFAKSQENWFKALIYFAINSNGDISPEKYKEILTSIIKSTNIAVTEPSIGDGDEYNKVNITQLKHISGVNALEPDQTIKFNSDITILYGMNGAGKSGYFKILNEIVGGNQEKDILQNIYSTDHSKIKVELKYIADANTETTIDWNGETRSIPKLNRCKVFDSSYLNGLLETRKTDQTLIQPLGLNLFTYLVDLLDDAKSKINSYADNIRTNKPNIKLEEISDEIKNVFINHFISKSEHGKIKKLFEFSEENQKNLSKIEKEIKDIKQINIQDKIKLLGNSKKELESVSSNLQQRNTTILDFIKNCDSNINQYKEKEPLNKEAKSRFELLETIPANDTQEWKDFIKTGEKYSEKIEGVIRICPYCRQSLTEEKNISIVQSYSLFLKDNSELELNTAIEKLELLNKEIEAFNIEIPFTENVTELLQGMMISEKIIFEEIKLVTENLSTIKTSLLKNISQKNTEFANKIIDVKPIVDAINSKITDIQGLIDEYSKEEAEKKENLVRLEEQFKKLIENKSISVQAEIIKKWIEDTVRETLVRKKEASISTRKLSNLSKIAHNDLLTESLKSRFNDELKSLGYSNLSVRLEDAGIRKGISSTKLVIEKDNDIKSILSEGEQKAVALSLFLSEIMLQKYNYPIILDDPVNSLDHKIAGNFAYRLMDLDNQIILLNHNRLFLDAFETSKDNHICKTTDSACNKDKGKHIKVYEVISQGKMSKGILKNYKGNYARNNLKEAKHLLEKTPFDEAMKVANLLRISVECIIDEVIFNHQIPTKYSNKNSRFNWTELKKLNKDESVVDTLQGIHSRASGGEMHNGTERDENPIEVEEFNEMITLLDGILDTARK